MKKFFLVVLAALLLTLWACGAEKDNGETALGVSEETILVSMAPTQGAGWVFEDGLLTVTANEFSIPLDLCPRCGLWKLPIPLPACLGVPLQAAP